MEGFYYTYELKSLKDNKFYVGYTQNVKLRFEQHNKGLVDSAKGRRPLMDNIFKFSKNFYIFLDK